MSTRTTRTITTTTTITDEDGGEDPLAGAAIEATVATATATEAERAMEEVPAPPVLALSESATCALMRTPPPAAAVSRSDSRRNLLTTFTPDLTPEEVWLALISQTRDDIDLNAEEMDPLEWTFRTLVPVPKYYYWEVQHPVIENNDGRSVSSSSSYRVPLRIQLWHNCIDSLSRAYQCMEKCIGRPLARGLGLEEPRMHSDVTMYMTEEDWKTSQRIVAERRERDAQYSKCAASGGDSPSPLYRDNDEKDDHDPLAPAPVPAPNHDSMI